VSPRAPVESCAICRGPIDAEDRHVLVRGRRQQAHCSDTCLRVNLRRRLLARAAVRRRLGVSLSLTLAFVLGGSLAWRRFHAPRKSSISYAWPEVHGQAPPPAPFLIGPPWPPTEAQWTALFDGARWTHPLPGPNRRASKRQPRILGPDREHSALCRAVGHCGVDLGGELWGEHVYAALDGVVERVQGDGNEAHGGRYVRIVHFGGTVYTQYFHLAATPRWLGRGTVVKAGDVIGLVGDTGLDEDARRHLTFMLSVLPSPAFSEVYWDPSPWLDRASLRQPPHGTVAGFVPRPQL
jgi:murein DD-endopeptidase MepM/ murein hydrolase activator NlpD